MTSTKTSFFDTNVGKTIKAAAYVGVSAVLSYLVTASTDNPELFGSLTAIINIALVFAKQTWFTPSTPNIGSN